MECTIKSYSFKNNKLNYKYLKSNKLNSIVSKLTTLAFMMFRKIINSNLVHLS